MQGIELEFFLVDNEGKISNRADEIISNAKKALFRTEIKKECGKSMLEVISHPHISKREIFDRFFDDFESLMYEVNVNDLGLYHYATYPGKNKNEMRNDIRYYAKQQILGEKRWPKAGKCVGFHCHFSLPKKSFNPLIKFFYPDIISKQKNKVLNLYNLCIAIDPAITSLMQSSPYYEGKLMGKDARIMVYRGDKVFGYDNSLYEKHPEFGTLNSYEPDFESLIQFLKKQSRDWKALLDEKEITRDQFGKTGKASFLDSSWRPVKISPHGTVESRGADMNSLPSVISTSHVLHSLSKYVQNENIIVQPSDIGNTNPFTLEDNILHVPLENQLKNVLQKNSALLGFDDRYVHKYSKALMSLVKRITPIEYRAPLRRFSQMIESKTTASDEIIKYVKKKQGYTNYEKIEQDVAKEFAVKCSDRIYKDILVSKKMSSNTLRF